jgi:hypothetical protein
LDTFSNRFAAPVRSHDTGVFVGPPGIGKTVLGTHLVAQRACSTLILVHRKPLLEQWIAQLAMFLEIDEKDIGQIGGGKRKPNGRLDVAMIQSLVRKEASRRMSDPSSQPVHGSSRMALHRAAQSRSRLRRRLHQLLHPFERPAGRSIFSGLIAHSSAARRQADVCIREAQGGGSRTPSLTTAVTGSSPSARSRSSHRLPCGHRRWSLCGRWSLADATSGAPASSGRCAEAPLGCVRDDGVALPRRVLVRERLGRDAGYLPALQTSMRSSKIASDTAPPAIE